jgi:hypothetical protein
MRFRKNISHFPKRYYLLVLPLIFLLALSQKVKAQEPPPRPISVTATAQSLSFGAFTPGSSGGTVTIGSDGTRSSTSDVILLGLGFSYSPALYDVVANEGTLISIMNGADVSLTGSNGGTMTLHIGDSDPVSPFITTLPYPEPTSLNIGGTLSVGNITSNPPGSYSGTFDITLVEE